MADPLVKLQFRPGLDLDNSALSSEDTFVDGDKLRFNRGLPEFVGGRSEAISTAFGGIARAAIGWSALDGTRFAAFGTTKGLFSYSEQSAREISPVSAVYFRAALSNPCTAGSATITINVTVGVTPLSVNVGDRMYIRVVAVSATPDSGGVDGWGTVTAFSSPTATVTMDKPAAASVATGHVIFALQKAAVKTSVVDGIASTPASYWSMDSFGEQLVAVKGPPPQEASADYPLYAWTPRSRYDNILNNPSFTSASAWALGANWYIGATSQKAYSIFATTNLSQNVAGEMLGGRLYTAIFTVSSTRNLADTIDNAYAGVGYLKATAGTPIAPVHLPPITTMSAAFIGGSVSAYSGVTEAGELRSKFTQVGTYLITFYAPPSPSDIVIQAGLDDASASGSFGIDNFTLFLWPNAYVIPEAPLNMSAIFSDPHGVLVGLGGLQINGDYNPLNVRCCDLGNLRSWMPDTNSLATELRLAKGSRGVGGVASAGLSIVGTDAAVYALNWLGSAGNAFSADLLGTGCGLIGPNAICEQNGLVFWASRNGPYTFSGSVPQIIECSMKDDVFNNFAPYQDNKVWVRTSPKFNEVWFAYADGRDEGGVNKEISRLPVFNFVENHWTRHMWDVTAWVTPGVFDHPIGFSVESANTCKMMWHEMGGSDNGSALSAFLVTGAFDIEDGGNIMRMTEVWPEWKGLTCHLNYTINTRMFPNAPNMVAGTPLVLTPTTIPPLRPRRDGRQFQIKLEANTTTLGGRQGVLRVRAQKTGASR